jgi:D-sedoheptulose 7-phosphate isomerase
VSDVREISLTEACRRARRVYIVGNGGSYANAMHMQNDLINAGIRAHTLDPATLTATANDHGYEYIYSRWLMLFGEPGDLLIAMSGSGKSPNILNAIGTARIIGMEVFRIFGNERNEDMQTAEEAQVKMGHEVMREMRK